MSTGIDNSYHYAMFLEQRLMSASSPLLASNADGTGFAFDDYPQWFHRLLTVLAQLTYGSPSTAPTELMRYSQLQWLVFMLLATLVTSAFMQALPHRTSALTLISATAVMYSLVLAVPGGINLIQGHLSFLVAACAPVVIFMLTIHQQRPGLGLFIVVGGLFLVAAAWSLLLPMALAASIPPLLAAWRQQSSAIRWITMLAAALTLLAMGGLFLWKPLTQGVLAAILRDGTVPRVGLPTLAAILLCSLFVLIALETRFGEIAFERHILMAVAAIMQLIALAAYMLMASGQLTYYFWKLGLGSVLVSVMTTIHAVTVAASLDDERTHPIRIRPVHAAVVVIISCIGLGSVLQQFTAPSLAWSVLVPTSLKERMAPGAAGDVDLPLRLARSMSPADAARTRLLATRPGDMNPAHASEWFHALSHSATRRAVSVDDGVYQLAGHPRDTALGVRLAMSTLSTDDGRVAVTDADLYRSILGTASPKQRPRVLLIR